MSTRARVIVAALFAVIAWSRFSNLNILWVEEAYPLAAAQELLRGKFLYRDIWFDKPPLYALVYLLWDAQAGWALRWAGTLFAALSVALSYRLSLQTWGEREALLAAVLTAFAITFGIPSAVMALAPDLLLLVPHIAAVLFAARGSAFMSGLCCGIGLLVNVKAMFILVVCLAWSPRGWSRLLAGFLAPNVFAWLALAANGAFAAYWEQVWWWGAKYSGDTYLADPLVEGLRRTANWIGFAATAVVGAVWYFLRERGSVARKALLWTVLSALSVCAGWRFFPRYFFQLLPPVVFAASAGLLRMRPLYRRLAILLLLIPVVRFAPRYVDLTRDLADGRRHKWRDLAMTQDSRAAALILKSASNAGDTLLVWGYRPDIFVYSGLAAGTPYLDSQPLTGVIADRHLQPQSTATFPELGARNRDALTRLRPTFIVDGLGPYNPGLAVQSFAGLRPWLSQYREIGRTNGTVIYRLASAPIH